MSSRAQQHPDRPAVLVGQAPGVGRDRRVGLAAEGPAVGQRRHRLPAGLAPRGVGLQVGGLDPRRAQGEVPVPVGHGQRRLGLDGRAATLHLAGGLPGLAERGADRVASLAVGDGHQGVGGCAVVGEATGAERHLGADPLGPAPLEGGPSGRGIQVPFRGGGAEATGPPRGSCASRCSGRGGRRAPCRPWPRRPGRRPCARAPSRRSTIPGVQKPHWLAPVAQKASAQRIPVRGVQAVEGGDGPTGDPAGRGHARHPRRPVDQHRAATALALGAAAVLRRPHARGGPAGPPAARPRRRPPRPGRRPPRTAGGDAAARSPTEDRFGPRTISPAEPPRNGEIRP